VVAGETVASIKRGLLLLVGVAQGDAEADAKKLARKAANMRIFAERHRCTESDLKDARPVDDRMQYSLLDVGGAALVVSQFTLLADCGRGRRPFFGGAEEPERASQLCEFFETEISTLGVAAQSGSFGAMMAVESCNDGPVTIWLDS